MSDIFDISARTRPVRDVVYETLKRAIIDGHYKPGNQLNERQLAQQFNISTTPLKEAFRHLEQEGMVETRPRVGTFVSYDIMTSLEEINLVRSALESIAARLAAKKITIEEASQLRDIIDEMKICTAKQDVQKLVKTNDQFHKLISMIAKNKYVAKQVEVTRSLDVKTILKQGELERSLLEHESIYNKIVSRDGDGAEEAMRKHISRNIEYIYTQKNSCD